MEKRPDADSDAMTANNHMLYACLLYTSGHRIAYPGYGGVHLGQAAGNVQRHVLEKVAHAYGAYHDGHSGSGAQGLIRYTLDEEEMCIRDSYHARL